MYPIQLDKTVFWNVDTQYDFMQDDSLHKGALYIQEAETILDNLSKMTNMARYSKIRTVNTADWHTWESAEFSDDPDMITSFPPHCIENTIGADFIIETSPMNAYKIDWRDENIDAQKIKDAQDIIIYKDAFDVFEGNRHTSNIVSIMDFDKVFVYGVAADVCVDFAIDGLVKKGKEVYAVADAMKPIPVRPLEETIQMWEDKGVKVIKTEDAFRYL